MKRANPPSERSREQDILAAAVNLLGSRDFGSITMDAVAAEAGVAKGTLFLYYPSKTALFSAAHEHIMETLHIRLAETLASGLHREELLGSAITIILDHCVKKRDLLFNAGSGESLSLGKKSADKLKARVAGGRKIILDILKICRDDGLISLSDDPMYDAAALFGLCRSAVTVHKTLDRTLSVPETVKKILSLYLDGKRRKK